MVLSVCSQYGPHMVTVCIDTAVAYPQILPNVVKSHRMPDTSFWLIDEPTYLRDSKNQHRSTSFVWWPSGGSARRRLCLVVVKRRFNSLDMVRQWHTYDRDLHHKIIWFSLKCLKYRCDKNNTVIVKQVVTWIFLNMAPQGGNPLRNFSKIDDFKGKKGPVRVLFGAN